MYLSALQFRRGPSVRQMRAFGGQAQAAPQAAPQRSLTNEEMRRITAERFGLTKYGAGGQRMKWDAASGQWVRWGI